jgi:hypothetical protein
MLVFSQQLKFIVVFILAHHFVGNNPRCNNGKNEKCDYDEKWPPGCYVHKQFLFRLVKIVSIRIKIDRKNKKMF